MSELAESIIDRIVGLKGSTVYGSGAYLDLEDNHICIDGWIKVTDEELEYLRAKTKEAEIDTSHD